MQALKADFSPEAFFAEVGRASQRVLMLDYDGTLAPFHQERDRAVPYPGVRERVGALINEGDTRVVLISGRMAREVSALADIHPSPEVWGTHGWERLSADGDYELAPLPPGALEGLDRAQTEAREVGVSSAGIERKPASVAVHLRGMSPAQADRVRSATAQRWNAFAAGHGLEVHAFDGGVELRVLGRSKGTAVDTLLAEHDSSAVAAYLGDDLTDEDAFRAIALRGLAVLVRPELRETAAACWLRPPEELLEFLDRWKDACGQSI